MEPLVSQTHGDVLVVYVAEARLVAAGQIQAAGDGLLEMMNRATHGKLLVNFQIVRMMSSAMIGKLMKLGKECAACKIDLKLTSICENIMEVFKLMKLDKILDIYDSEADALKAFRRKGWFHGR